MTLKSQSTEVLLSAGEAHNPAASDVAHHKRQLEAICNHATVALFIVDERQHCTYMNPSAERLTGYTLAEIRERPLHYFVHHTRPDGSPYPLEECPLVQAFPRNNQEQGEEIFVHRDGSFYPVAFTATPIREEGVSVSAIIEVRDRTREKLAEESLRERTLTAMLGADVGLALTQGDTIQNMLHACAEAIVRHLDAAFARVWTLNADENVLELQASAGMYTHTDGPHGRVPVGQFKIGLIAQERKPHLTNAVVGDPRVGDQEWAKREGMVAFAGYPLIVDDRLVGVMGMFARRALSEAVIQAMSAVANDIALGIVRKRAEEDRERLQREIIGMQRSLLAELSTPLIPIKDGIVVMPLVGTMNEERAAQMLEALLNGVASSGAHVAIVDITGVKAVDSQVANMLMMAAQAVQLLGTEIVITGIRGNVAQTLVRLGVDLQGIVTRRDLKSGIEHAEKLWPGMKLQKRDER